MRTLALLLALSACGSSSSSGSGGDPPDDSLPLISGDPVLLVSWAGDRSDIGPMAADETHVWWLDKESMQILTVPRVGGGDPTVATTTNEISTHLRVRDGPLYWGSASGLYRFDPGATEPVRLADTMAPAGGVRFLTGLTVADDVAVFTSGRFDGSAGALAKVGLDGTGAAVLVDQVNLGSPIVEGDQVLFLDGESSTIQTVSLDGSDEPRTLFDVKHLSDEALFVAGNRIYVGEYPDATPRQLILSSFTMNGGDERVELDTPNVVSFARDSSWYYWVDFSTGDLRAAPRWHDGEPQAVAHLDTRINMIADDNGLLWFDGSDLWALPR